MKKSICKREGLLYLNNLSQDIIGKNCRNLNNQSKLITFTTNNSRKMKKIVDFVKYLESPIINGILFPDETIQPFDVKVKWDRPMNYTIEVMPKTSIQILNDNQELGYSTCGILTRLIDEKNRWKSLREKVVTAVMDL